MENKRLTGTLAALFTVLVWGTTFIVTKNLMADFNAAEILFVRYFIAWVLLSIGSSKEQKCEKAEKKDQIIFFLIALNGLFLYGILEILSMKYTYTSNTSTIVSSAPFFTALFTSLYFKEEKPSALFYIGFVVAISGVALISFNGATEFGLNPLGDLFALGASIVWGLYTVFVIIAQKKGYSTREINRNIYMWASLTMLLSLPLFGLNTDFSRFLNVKTILSLLFLGVVASCICFLTWTYATKSLGAINSSVFIYINPVVTIVFASIFLKERINAVSALGIVLVIAGTVLSSIRRKK